MKALLVGNYGVGNLGDEALMEYFLHTFPGVDWSVVSASPRSCSEYARLPGGIRSLLTTQWFRTIGAFWRTDAVVFGGGTLFTDIESVFACFLWWMHAFLARLLGKKRFFAFQGIGPFKTKRGRWFARSALRGATHISVRDGQSFLRAESLMPKSNIFESFDPVYQEMCSYKPIESKTKKLVIIPRTNSGAAFRESVETIMKSDTWDEIVILLMQDNNLNILADDIPHRLVTVYSVEELLHEVSDAFLVIAQRYHGALAALALGKDVHICPQHPGDKLASLQQEIENKECLERINVCGKELARLLY